MVEALDSFHQADIAFLHEIGHRQAARAESRSDAHDEAGMRLDDLVHGPLVALVVPAPGEFHFVFPLQNGRIHRRRDIAPVASFRCGRVCVSHGATASFPDSRIFR